MIFSFKFTRNSKTGQLYSFTICVQIWANKRHYKQFNTTIMNKVNLLNIEKNGFLALLLNIEREFQRNYSELICDKEKFISFCDEKTEKFIYPEGKKNYVCIYIMSYLLHTENNKFQQIIDNISTI